MVYFHSLLFLGDLHAGVGFGAAKKAQLGSPGVLRARCGFRAFRVNFPQSGPTVIQELLWAVGPLVFAEQAWDENVPTRCVAKSVFLGILGFHSGLKHVTWP